MDAMRLATIRDGAQRGLTQGQVGEVLGISKQAVSVWLKGRKIKWADLQVPLRQIPESLGVKGQANKKKGKVKSGRSGVMAPKDSSNPQGQSVDVGILDRYDKISEELYGDMLLAAAKKDPANLRIITEVRNWLDATGRLTVEKGDLNVDIEVARDIELRARALLKDMEIKLKKKKEII